MKKHIIILLLATLKTLCLEAQDINQLMQDYDNLYALEHIELFTKPENEVNYDDMYGVLFTPPKFHRSLKIVNVDTDWLQSITNLVTQDPTILYPYLDTETQNLAAYILLLHILEFDMPKTGQGYQETASFNLLKEDVFNPDYLPKYKAYKNTPIGEDPARHVLNTIWKDIVYQGANTRLKAIVEQ